MLIATAGLAQQLNHPDWVIFDCRHDLVDKAKGERLYRDSHLPGAHFARVESDLSGNKTGRNGRHPLSEAQSFADFLGRHGVTPGSTVVAYDDVGGQYAARLWWMARWIGFKDVRVLDGGWSKWIAEARPTTTDVPVAAPGGVQAAPDHSMVWSLAQVEDNLRTGQAVILDARTAERYRGETEPIDPVAGHIPGAINRFFKLNLNPDLTVRPAGELRREFEQLIQSAGGRPVVHQCGSGVTACANLFAMEYAGLAGSKLYAGSWSEWIADPSRPIARGGNP
ncbi:MAG: sulfurtransferase [Opitutaceae bacterium]|nr:sulfurtransferase [Opitutaceae bacterium]